MGPLGGFLISTGHNTFHFVIRKMNYLPEFANLKEFKQENKNFPKDNKNELILVSGIQKSRLHSEVHLIVHQI